MSDIVIKNLSKSFGEKKVFSDLSAVIPGGRFTALMGASGSGKTTLSRLLLGLEKVDGGSIEGLPDRLSAVFQEDRLFESFSAISNLRAVAGRKKDHELAALLETLGLGSEVNSPVSSFSGGMKRRVAIARAIAAEGELTVLDEPFSGLDGDTKAAVMDVIKDRLSKSTVLLITHDPSEAEFFGADIIRL